MSGEITWSSFPYISSSSPQHRSFLINHYSKHFSFHPHRLTVYSSLLPHSYLLNYLGEKSRKKEEGEESGVSSREEKQFKTEESQEEGGKKEKGSGRRRRGRGERGKREEGERREEGGRREEGEKKEEDGGGRRKEEKGREEEGRRRVCDLLKCGLECEEEGLAPIVEYITDCFNMNMEAIKARIIDWMGISKDNWGQLGELLENIIFQLWQGQGERGKEKERCEGGGTIRGTIGGGKGTKEEKDARKENNLAFLDIFFLFGEESIYEMTKELFISNRDWNLLREGAGLEILIEKTFEKSLFEVVKRVFIKLKEKERKVVNLIEDNEFITNDNFLTDDLDKIKPIVSYSSSHPTSLPLSSLHPPFTPPLLSSNCIPPSSSFTSSLQYPSKIITSPPNNYVAPSVPSFSFDCPPSLSNFPPPNPLSSCFNLTTSHVNHHSSPSASNPSFPSPSDSSYPHPSPISGKENKILSTPSKKIVSEIYNNRSPIHVTRKEMTKIHKIPLDEKKIRQNQKIAINEIEIILKRFDFNTPKNLIEKFIESLPFNQNSPKPILKSPSKTSPKKFIRNITSPSLIKKGEGKSQEKDKRKGVEASLDIKEGEEEGRTSGRGRGREEGKNDKEEVVRTEKEAGEINKEDEEVLNWDIKIKFFEEKAEEILEYCREIKMKSRRPRNERKTKL